MMRPFCDYPCCWNFARCRIAGDGWQYRLCRRHAWRARWIWLHANWRRATWANLRALIRGGSLL